MGRKCGESTENCKERERKREICWGELKQSPVVESLGADVSLWFVARGRSDGLQATLSEASYTQQRLSFILLSRCPTLGASFY